MFDQTRLDYLNHLSKSGNNIHHDEDKIVKYSLEVMIDALEKHISGEQLKAQKHRLEEEAEKKAKSLSMDKGGVLVAVWQDGDRVVRLFAGGDEFVPVKL